MAYECARDYVWILHPKFSLKPKTRKPQTHAYDIIKYNFTYMYKPLLIHTHLLSHTRAHTHTHIHIQSQIHTQAHTRIHTRTHAHTHTSTHSYRLVEERATLRAVIGDNWIKAAAPWLAFHVHTYIQYVFVFVYVCVCDPNCGRQTPTQENSGMYTCIYIYTSYIHIHPTEEPSSRAKWDGAAVPWLTFQSSNYVGTQPTYIEERRAILRAIIKGNIRRGCCAMTRFPELRLHKAPVHAVNSRENLSWVCDDEWGGCVCVWWVRGVCASVVNEGCVCVSVMSGVRVWDKCGVCACVWWVRGVCLWQVRRVCLWWVRGVYLSVWWKRGVCE